MLDTRLGVTGEATKLVLCVALKHSQKPFGFGRCKTVSVVRDSLFAYSQPHQIIGKIGDIQ
jgi:hypothetical protein